MTTNVDARIDAYITKSEGNVRKGKCKLLLSGEHRTVLIKRVCFRPFIIVNRIKTD